MGEIGDITDPLKIHIVYQCNAVAKKEENTDIKIEEKEHGGDFTSGCSVGKTNENTQSSSGLTFFKEY